MKRQQTPNFEKIEFETYPEFIKFLKDSQGVYLGTEKDSEKENAYWSNFTKTDSYKEMLQLAEFGWDEGTKLVKDTIEKIEVIGKGYTFTPVYDVAGESVDVGRFLSGEPECMQEWQLTEQKDKKIVDVYFNTFCSAMFDGTQMINYGAAALSCVDYLESIGVRVNLYSMSLYSNRENGGSKKLVCVKVKDAKESLNLSVCAFALCHPSMMRRAFGKTQEAIRGIAYDHWGYPSTCTKADLSTDDCVFFETLNNAQGAIDRPRMKFADATDTLYFLKKQMPQILNDLKLETLTKYD